MTIVDHITNHLQPNGAPDVTDHDDAAETLDALIREWNKTSALRLHDYLGVPEAMCEAWAEDRISAAQLLAVREVSR